MPMLSEMHVQRYTDITQEKQRWNDEIGPGHYSTKGGLEPKKLSIPMSDRGLLPLNDEQQRSKLRLYNNSHLHLGPGQYNSSIEVHNATTLKKSKGYAK